jgi:hypothetical protein
MFWGDAASSAGGLAASSGAGVSTGAGGCWRQRCPHFAQRTLRPFGPNNEASSEKRVAQAGQLTITTRLV